MQVGVQVAVDLHPCGSGHSAHCICGVARKERVAVDLHLVFLAECMLYLYLGEGYAAAKPLSGRFALHPVGFFFQT